MPGGDGDSIPLADNVKDGGNRGSGITRDVAENPTRLIVEHDKSMKDHNASGNGVKTKLSDFLGGNEYFAAGFGLMGLGVGLAYLRQITTRGSNWLYHRMLVDLEIPSKDKSYNWLLEWMAKNGPHQKQLLQQQQILYQRQLEGLGPGSKEKVAKNPIIPQQQDKSSGLGEGFKGRLSGMFNRVHHLSVNTIYKQHDNGSATATFNLVPGPGTHWMLYNKAIIRFSRERSGRLMDLTNGSPFETIKLTTLYRDRHIFGELLDEARSLAVTMQQGKTVMYTSWGPEWRPFGMPRRKRVLNSVILDVGIKEAILQDVEDFLSTGNWYYDRGIPYRRGYLLYGPPGSGKSSFIQALAGHLDYNICILNLSEANLTDDRLNHLMNHIPERSILLLEDIDAAFNARKQSQEKGFQSGVTFSGLLNSLDGVASSEERIIFMTTNHRDRLDPALIRPGRVDAQWEINWATPYQIKCMFNRFYGKDVQKSNDDIIHHNITPKQFTDAVLALDTQISTAQLQGLFVFNKNRPDKALEMVPLLKQQ